MKGDQIVMACYVLGPVLGTGDSVVNKSYNPCAHGAYSLVGKMANKHRNT